MQWSKNKYNSGWEKYAKEILAYSFVFFDQAVFNKINLKGVDDSSKQKTFRSLYF